MNNCDKCCCCCPYRKNYKCQQQGVEYLVKYFIDLSDSLAEGKNIQALKSELTQLAGIMEVRIVGGNLELIYDDRLIAVEDIRLVIE